MSHVLTKSKAVLAALACLSVLFIASAEADQAEASWSNYCNPVTLGGYGSCTGGLRKMNQVMAGGISTQSAWESRISRHSEGGLAAQARASTVLRSKPSPGIQPSTIMPGAAIPFMVCHSRPRREGVWTKGPHPLECS